MLTKPQIGHPVPMPKNHLDMEAEKWIALFREEERKAATAENPTETKTEEERDVAAELLALLAKKPGQTTAQLAEALGVESVNLLSVLRRLEETHQIMRGEGVRQRGKEVITWMLCDVKNRPAMTLEEFLEKAQKGSKYADIAEVLRTSKNGFSSEAIAEKVGARPGTINHALSRMMSAGLMKRHRRPGFASGYVWQLRESGGTSGKEFRLGV